MGTQGAANTATAAASLSQANANDASDDEESVDVTGAGFDDDLTSLAGGLESMQQSDRESDTAADQDPDFEPAVNTRRSTRSASSCAIAAPIAPSTKGKGRGKKRKVPELDEEVVANVRPSTSAPIVTPMTIPKPAAVQREQVIDLVNTGAATPPLSTPQKKKPTKDTTPGSASGTPPIASTSSTPRNAAVVTRNEPDEVTPSRGRKGPKKQVLATAPASKADNAGDVAAERLRVVQRMADRLEGQTELDHWSNMIVKRIERVTDIEVRDELMQHISVITSQAVRGKWHPRIPTTPVAGLPSFLRSNPAQITPFASQQAATLSASQVAPQQLAQAATPSTSATTSSQALQPVHGGSLPVNMQPAATLPSSYTSSFDDFTIQQELMELRRFAAGMMPGSPSTNHNPVFCQNYNRITGKTVEFEEM